jgi:hypothetical protein
LTLINVLKEPPEDPEVIAVRKQFVAGRIVRQLLEQAPVHVYAKWRWNANGRWWKPPASSGSNVEAVDWGPSQPNLVVTPKALTVLSAVP